MGAVEAFLNYGSVDQWPTRDGKPPKSTSPLTGLGMAWGHSSIPNWKKSEATTTIRVWRSTAFWDGSHDSWAGWRGRYGTVPVWRRRNEWNPFAQFAADLQVNATPCILPWGPGWTGAGGQTANKDNGLIIEEDSNRRWSVQGLRPVHLFDIWDINLRSLRPAARLGDYVCDALRYDAPGVEKRGSQGPISKWDGLIRPELLDDGVEPEFPIRMVGFNLMNGPGAWAVPPGWVEHPAPGQRNNDKTLTVWLPEGADYRVFPCYTLFKLVISDEQIERWLDFSGVPVGSPLRATKRNLARWIRSRGIRAAESGTGNPIFESNGKENPEEEFKWGLRGVVGEKEAREIAKDLFLFGELVEG